MLFQKLFAPGRADHLCLWEAFEDGGNRPRVVLLGVVCHHVVETVDAQGLQVIQQGLGERRVCSVDEGGLLAPTNDVGVVARTVR